MLRFKKHFFLSVIFIQITLSCGFNIGWECESDADCTTTKSKCIENYCKCNTGHVYNSNLTNCLKVVTSYEELCEDTVQCSAYLWNGASCELKLQNGIVEIPKKTICVCGKGYHYLHGRCYRSSGLGEKCNSDDECYVNSDFEASTCKNGTCVCSNGFYKREYRTCRRAANGVGEDCVIDLDCKFNKDANCSKEFKCIFDEKLNILSQNINKVEIKLNNNSDLSNKCKTDKDCKTNTICGPELKCICKRAYFNFKGECIPEIGEPCLKLKATKIEDSVCRNGRWSCKAEKVVSKNNQLCRKVTTEINKSCVYNEQCYIFGPDAFCNKKKCSCNENSHYVEEEQFCWINKGIGESCTSNNDCYIQGSEFALSCKNSICICPVGTLSNPEKTLCVKIPTGINASCKKADDCKINNGTCISKVCSCNENFIPISEDTCVEISSYGNKCDHHIQCNATLTNGICSRTNDTVEGENSTSGICMCAYTDHYNNGNCFVKKFLGDNCQIESECFLEKDNSRVKCTNGICSCDRNCKKLSKSICVKSGSAVIYLPFWIGLIATVCNLLIL